MYHIFVFSPLVEMLRKKYPALITLNCFPVSYCKYIQFSKLFLRSLVNEGERAFKNNLLVGNFNYRVLKPPLGLGVNNNINAKNVCFKFNK